MSSEDEFHTVDDELQDFIVDDVEEVDGQGNALNNGDKDLSDDEEPKIDRLKQLATTLKPNETPTQKILKAHISVLVSALGGPDHTSKIQPPPYKLGQDALACLKDIKRWIKSVDDLNSNYDVALACGDCGLVINDLVVILCQWDSQLAGKLNQLPPVKNVKQMERIMLSILELLVSLTWPNELTPESSDTQRLSFSNLRKYQIIYKKHILTYNNGQTLKAILRLILPILAKEKNDREKKDNQILKLSLFFIRNILYIGPIKSSISMKTSKEISNIDMMPSNVSMDDISINNVVNVFKKNKVFTFLLTMSNLIGNEFDKNFFGMIVLECINLIIKNVDVNDLVNPLKSIKQHNKTSLQNDNLLTKTVGSMTTTSGLQLNDLLKEENRRKKVQNQNISTRHGRFGTLLSIQGDEQNYVISGQEALVNNNSSMDKLDKSKKWKKPPNFKYDSDEFINNEKVYLTSSNLIILKCFINDFLNGGCFNNLISQVSNILSSADDLTMIKTYDNAVYYLTVAWFFNYIRERNQYYKSNPDKLKTLSDEEKELIGFHSINDGLSQTNFILILSYFRSSYEAKNWSAVHVAMICFLELLLISHTLFITPIHNNDNDDDEESQEMLDKELGEGIIRNLFTSYDFLNVLIQIPQTASKHSPDYLRKCIYMVHILLKSFESFTKENITLYIQKRRKKYKKDKKSIYNDIESRASGRIDDLMDYSDDEVDQQRAKSEKLERELDLERTEIRFFHTSTINSYIDFLSEYEDLSHDEIKRCLSYFHRLFVMKKDYNALYRIDFMILLQKLRNYLPRSSSIRNHVEEFIIYFMKKFKTAFTRFPNPVEILFPRIEDTTTKIFLTTGELHIKSTGAKNQPRLARDIEFIRDFTLDEKVKILITALLYQEKELFIKWLIGSLENLIKSRIHNLLESDEGIDDSIKAPDNFRRLLINNPYIRCLLSLSNFELPEILEENLELPKTIPTGKVVELLELIKKWMNEQPVSFEDAKDPFYFMRTKEYSDDGDYNDNEIYGDGYGSDEDIAFQTQGNATQSKYMEELENLDKMEAQISSSQTLGVAKKKSKKQGPSSPGTKTKKKSKSSRASRAPRENSEQTPSQTYHGPAKSSEFINDSDEESDDERDSAFFEREEKLRRLLSESGGIINPKQLEEFKKVWSTVLDNNSKSIDESISKAIESANENFRASNVNDSQSSMPSQVLSQLHAQSQIDSSQIQLHSQSGEEEQEANGSTRLSFSSDEESQPESGNESDVESGKEATIEDESDGSEGGKENRIPNQGKRSKTDYDGDSDDDDDGDTFTSAKKLSRRKKMRLDDDDDE